MAQDPVLLDDLKGLDRLTEKAKKSIVIAFEEAKKYGGKYCQPVHLFLGLIKEQGGLAGSLLTKMGLDVNATVQLIEDKLADVPTAENPISPEFSEDLKTLINSAYIISQKMSHVYVGTEHLLIAIMEMESLDFVTELNKVGITADKIERLVETSGTYPAGAMREGNEIINREGGQQQQSSLQYFAVEMNELAKNKKYLPTFGREKEISRLIHILARKTKNNPILVGDAGVGKTAIVEGFVQRIVDQNVPASFLNKKVLNLDIAGILAGSRVRGDVEERVLAIVNDALAEGDKILFIDEIHMIVGAGGAGSGGGIDIANILKPYLTNSDLRVIGATTVDEYRKYFETDSALTRRFQPINIDEIDPKSAIAVLDHLKSTFEDYHRVKITEDAIEEAVRLSRRYIADRYLPDKAIDLIDEASAQVKIGKEVEIEPQLSGLGKKLLQMQRKKEDAIESGDIAAASKYKDRESEITQEIVQMVEGPGKGNKRKKVTADLIRSIVSSWTNIPISDESMNDNLNLSKLTEILKTEVIGQDHAIETVVNAVKRSHLGITDEKKPLSSFIFLGPTGIGKSQLAKSLAKALFGSEEMIVQIDMSEYMESHSVSKMIGSPPGYVGYQEGGQLTEKIRRRPYSVVLFDEIEKAHPDVLNILLQILNDGHLQDGKGNQVSFRNTIIILTSNIGAEEISNDSKLGFDITPEREDDKVMEEAFSSMSDRILDEMKDYLRPELLNRIDEVIVFRGLNATDCLSITAKFIEDLRLRLIEKGIILEVDKAVAEYINQEGYSKEYGSRNLKRKMQELLENSLANFLITNRPPRNKKSLMRIDVHLDKDNQFIYEVK